MSVRIAEEERQRNRCRPADTLRAEGVVGDLCVPRRRRCPCIASSSLLDLTSQAPSANVIVFMKRGTRPPIVQKNMKRHEVLTTATSNSLAPAGRLDLNFLPCQERRDVG